MSAELQRNHQKAAAVVLEVCATLLRRQKLVWFLCRKAISDDTEVDHT